MIYKELIEKQQEQEIAFYHEFWKHYIELEKFNCSTN